VSTDNYPKVNNNNNNNNNSDDEIISPGWSTATPTTIPAVVIINFGSIRWSPQT
jgi:hypothetical protein